MAIPKTRGIQVVRPLAGSSRALCLQTQAGWLLTTLRVLPPRRILMARPGAGDSPQAGITTLMLNPLPPCSRGGNTTRFSWKFPEGAEAKFPRPAGECCSFFREAKGPRKTAESTQTQLLNPKSTLNTSA